MLRILGTMKRLNLLLCFLAISFYLFAQNRVDDICAKLFNPNDKTVLVVSHRGRVKQIMRGRCRIWYNTLWNTHDGGHDEDFLCLFFC